jgi:hypothetical protein
MTDPEPQPVTPPEPIVQPVIEPVIEPAPAVMFEPEVMYRGGVDALDIETH